jgi:hypothetical protein
MVSPKSKSKEHEQQLDSSYTGATEQVSADPQSTCNDYYIQPRLPHDEGSDVESETGAAELYLFWASNYEAIKGNKKIKPDTIKP